MKHFYYTLLILVSFLGCKKEEKNQDEFITAKNEVKIGKPFFDFDEIDYYSINEIENDSISDLTEIYDNENKSKIGKLKFDIVLGKIPKNIQDSNFIKKLHELGFTKINVSKAKHSKINQIFSEKEAIERIDAACIPAYRDILIFRKKNKNIGIAKICFGCMKKMIVGTTANTFDFGQDGDFENLENLLKN